MFLVFAGSSYYPQGGWKDKIDAFETFEQAMEAVVKVEAGVHEALAGLPAQSYLWWQVVGPAPAPSAGFVGLLKSGLRRGEGHWERQEHHRPVEASRG